MTAVNGSQQYATAAAFRRALEDRLRAEATRRGRSMNELRREFVFQRFLSLVFRGRDGLWVLKGGAGLLMRLPEARFSRDLDLLHLGEISAEEAVAELRTLTAPSQHDHLTFVVENGMDHSGTNPVVTVRVSAYLGGTYDQFPIDLARELHPIARPERVRPVPVVDVPGLPDPPEVLVYPLTDQVADKVCAMYERHGDADLPSTRYRDLVDLVLIVTTCELDGEMTHVALQAESTRRSMKLPPSLSPPATSWEQGYAAYARKTKLSSGLHSLNAALHEVARCIDPLLDGSRTRGRWTPNDGWVDAGD